MEKYLNVKFALISGNVEQRLPNLDSFSSQVGDKSESLSMNQELTLFTTRYIDMIDTLQYRVPTVWKKMYHCAHSRDEDPPFQILCFYMFLLLL
jgi:hypothetical protein